MRHLFLCLIILGLLPEVLRVDARTGPGNAVAQSQNAVPSTSPQQKMAPGPDYVGADTCATCHSGIAEKFATNPHWRLALTHGGNGVTCENCHGPGKAHVDGGGDTTKIFRFTTARPQQIDTKCLGCHAGAHPNFERTAHGEANVSCTGCHSVHAFERDTRMLKTAQPQLCYSCHTDVRPAFSQPFHHRVDEGLIQCTDCHDPHGTFQPQLLKTTAEQNAICVKCHSDKAGPFIYEHPPVKIEGCTSCHFPHGSPNPRLLTRNTMTSLCLQCHTASMNFTAPGTPSFHNLANQYQACTVCHTQIHGSNASNVFFK